jgi:hypothetical protein
MRASCAGSCSVLPIEPSRAVLPTEQPLSLLLAEKERMDQYSTPTETNAANRGALMAEHMRLVNEIERPRRDYREIMTMGMEARRGALFVRG